MFERQFNHWANLIINSKALFATNKFVTIRSDPTEYPEGYICIHTHEKQSYELLKD